MRSPVLVHYHIFKNAGTSIDLALRESFGERWTTFEGEHAHDIKSHLDLCKYISLNDAVRAVSTHLARPHNGVSEIRPIAFLRHPILRMRSVYEFTRLNDGQTSNHVAQDRNFAGYLEWCFGEGRRSGGVVIRNYQVVHLSQASFRSDSILNAEAELCDLAYARELISLWGFIGIVEHYASSCHKYVHMYKDIFPELELKLHHENKTRGDLRRLDIQISDIKDEIGQSLYDRALMENQFDLELYDWATRQFAPKLHENIA